MAQAAQQFDSDPQRYPRLSPDEQRIADAVVAALRSELQPIIDTQEQHSKLLANIQPIIDTQEQHSKLLANIQPIMDTQEQHSKLLANIQPIMDTQEQHTKLLENIQQELRGVNKILASEGFIPDNPDL